MANHEPGTIIVGPQGMPAHVVRLIAAPKLATWTTIAAGLEADELIHTTEAHYAELRSHGVRTANPDYYLEGESLVIVTDRIAGWSLNRDERPAVPPTPQDQIDIYAAEARTGLRSYGEAISRGKRRTHTALGGYILGEITPEKQWMIGTSMIEPELGEGMIEVDPDAIIVHAHPDTLRDFLWNVNNLRP